MENPRYPNFLIAGAAKCGTTSLYNYLNQHPEIYFPDLKEPSFLALPALKFPHKGPGDWTNDNKIVKDIHQYTSLYQGADSEKRLGDASPNTFFYYQESIPNIKKLLGDIPIIIILRNPVDIVISSHRYLSRDSRENIPLEEAFIESDLRVENNFYFLWNYVQLGLLSKRVNAFKQNFTKVFVLSIDNLINNPQEYLMRLCTFLEVENSFNFSFGTRYNQSGIPNNFF